MSRIVDNYDLWEQEQEKADEWENSRPVCEACGEHIQSEYMFDVCGTFYCEDCMRSLRRDVNDYLESRIG